MVVSTEQGWEINWDKLAQTTKSAVRFLDNVIDANQYPVKAIEEMTKANRKIGLGVMGWADLLIRLGIPYNSEEGVKLAERVMGFIQEQGHQASYELAQERGAFPNYPGSVYEKQGKPRRNATVTTIAPTGTISIIAGVSSGVEPLFALAFTRNVMDNDRLIEVNPLFEQIMKEAKLYSQELMEKVAEKGSVQELSEIPEALRRVLVTAHDISPEWHIRMQAAFQKYTDNAVSKTVNFPQTASREDIDQVYRLAYTLGCKGVTVYRSGSREGEVLTVGHKQESKEANNDLRSSTSPRRRPQVTRGQTERVKTGCGTLYVTINEDEQGICEVFTTIGKAGGCAGAFSEANARLISLSLRSGVAPEQISKQLRGIRCPHPMWQNGELILSCPDAIARVIHRYLRERNAASSETESMVAVASDVPSDAASSCPECSGRMKYESGCATCIDCGYSRCS